MKTLKGICINKYDWRIAEKCLIFRFWNVCHIISYEKQAIVLY